jgi:hypothetical protein
MSGWCGRGRGLKDQARAVLGIPDGDSQAVADLEGGQSGSAGEDAAAAQIDSHPLSSREPHDHIDSGRWGRLRGILETLQRNVATRAVAHDHVTSRG